MRILMRGTIDPLADMNPAKFIVCCNQAADLCSP